MKRLRLLTILLCLSILPLNVFGGTVTVKAQSGGPGRIFLPMVQNPAGAPVEPPSTQPTSPTPTGMSPDGWTLTFEDHFTGSSLDRNKWRTDYWNGGNGELQEYVNDDGHKNYLTADHDLSLVARRESYSGKSYTSGVISTNQRFSQKYGFFEMRAQLPHGKGLWSAFWLMPDPNGWPPEIDILENLGNDNTVYMTLHYSGGQRQGYTSTDCSTGFHTYGVDWRADHIAWYIDGVEKYRVTDKARIPSQNMFILANLAIGGNWPGNPDSSTPFPSEMKIDYIRAWK